ncbi:MAG TPA: putative hydro-lyase [Pyrinomonadaceae bacterium]|nr:putative hydro-lyase [Pyrinomonadaceae bacterium]
MKSLNPREARLLFRTGQYSGYTSSFCAGYVQGSLCILPKEYALDFATYCHRNPKACPLIAIGDVGDPFLPLLGEDLDIRTDVPRYMVFRDGEVVEEPTDIKHLWRDDLVAFVWGCGFSFEHALIVAGVSLRDIARGDNVVMYETNVETLPVGPFAGKLIVTMRPLIPAHAIRAIQITSRFTSVHGAPIHIGNPELIGISDLEKPLFNMKSPQVRPDEIPVFWACGVTPRLAIHRARLSFCITHKPGSMVIADQLNTSLAIL